MCGGRRSESEQDMKTRQEELQFCHVTDIYMIFDTLNLQNQII